jgi:hypothetical protein
MDASGGESYKLEKHSSSKAAVLWKILEKHRPNSGAGTDEAGLLGRPPPSVAASEGPPNQVQTLQ